MKQSRGFTKLCGLPGLFCLLAGLAWAQDAQRPPLKVPLHAATIEGFASPEWRLESNPENGDLNKDGRPDAAFVLTAEKRYPETDASYVCHVLVVAFKLADGTYQRDLVNDDAVWDGDEGGAFGDPFDSLEIKQGVLTIQHYGGSRHRWSYGHTYRWQEGKWWLIGLGESSFDSLDLDHGEDKNIDLLTGYTTYNYTLGELKADYPRRKPQSGTFYTITCPSAETPPRIDGIVSPREWLSFYQVRLNQRRQLKGQASRWKGPADLSALTQCAQYGEAVYLLAKVTDDHIMPGDIARLVNKRGVVVKPDQMQLTANKKGYFWEARYSLTKLARAITPAGKEIYPIGSIFELDLSFELVDVDQAGPRSVLSTRMAGSNYPGSLRKFEDRRFLLQSDTDSLG